MMKNTIIFLNALNSHENLASYVAFSKSDVEDHIVHKLAKNEYFNFDEIEFRNELLCAFKDPKFDWYELLKKSELGNQINKNRGYRGALLSFSYDDMITIIGGLDFKSMETDLSNIEIKKEIREFLKEEYLPNYSGIQEFVEKKLNWLNFEVKHQIFSNIGEDDFQNEDVIFYLKKNVWDYLFPDLIDQDRLVEIKKSCYEILKNEKSNDGWVDTSFLIEKLNGIYQNIDLFELSKVNWDGKIQHMNHYRNPFTLGFKKYVGN